VNEINKKIKFSKFPITTENVGNIARLPKLTLGKVTVRGGVERQHA
jgi:hypothetical protein